MSLVNVNVKTTHYAYAQTERMQFFARPMAVGKSAPWCPPPPSDGSPVIYVDDFGMPIYSELPSWAITPDGLVDFAALEAGPPAFPPVMSDPASIQLVSGSLADHMERITLAEVERRRRASLSASISRTRSSIYDIGLNNGFDHFVTLTFYEPGSPYTPSAFSGNPRDYYSCSAMLLKFTRLLRESCPGIRYIFLFEHHPGGHGYHVHGLLSAHPCLDKYIVPAYTPDGRRVYNKGRPVSNLTLWHYGRITDIEPIEDQKKSVSYLLKYITKDLVESVPVGRKRYWASRTCSRPLIEYGVIDPELAPTVFDASSYVRDVASRWRPHTLAECGRSVYDGVIMPFDMSDQSPELLDNLSEICCVENIKSVTGAVYAGPVPFYVLFSKNLR